MPKPNLALISLYDLENNAVRLLASYARSRGYKAVELYFKDWVNNYYQPPAPEEYDSLIGLLQREAIDLVGISLRSSPYIRAAIPLTRLIQERLGLPVLWGGTHAILCPEESIGFADAVCLGDGEETVVAYLEALEHGRPLEELPNLWLRRGQQVFRNEVSAPIPDLDAYPFRDYTHPDKYVIMGRKVRTGDPMLHDPLFEIMGSRGCPFSCSFCYNSAFKEEIFKHKGAYFRRRSPENVIAELRLARRNFKNLRRIKFDDEIFPFEPEWVERFCQLYRDEIALPFEIFTEPKIVAQDNFEKLTQAGLEVVYMGIQNTHRISKELYNRDAAEAKIMAAVRLFRRLGLDSRYQVIVDDPLSDASDKEYLFNFLLGFPRPFELYLFSLTVYPRTALAKKFLAEGRMRPQDIEGQTAGKTFKQLRVSLNYPRAPEDHFWVALLVMLTKPFIPLGCLRRISRSRFWKRQAWLLGWLAELSNIVKMSLVVLKMLRKGELTLTAVKRWANVRSMITQ